MKIIRDKMRSGKHVEQHVFQQKHEHGMCAFDIYAGCQLPAERSGRMSTDIAYDTRVEGFQAVIARVILEQLQRRLHRAYALFIILDLG